MERNFNGAITITDTNGTHTCTESLCGEHLVGLDDSTNTSTKNGNVVTNTTDEKETETPQT